MNASYAAWQVISKTEDTISIKLASALPVGKASLILEYDGEVLRCLDPPHVCFAVAALRCTLKCMASLLAHGAISCTT